MSYTGTYIDDVYPNKDILLANKAANITFTPDFEQYICKSLDVASLEKRSTYLRELADECQNAILKNESTAFLIEYSPLVGHIMQIIHEQYCIPNDDPWLFFTFYHSDDELRKANRENDLVKIQAETLESMKQFPFIKTMALPYGYQLTYVYYMDLQESLCAYGW